jgi:hypothetical protein
MTTMASSVSNKAARRYRTALAKILKLVGVPARQLSDYAWIMPNLGRPETDAALKRLGLLLELLDGWDRVPAAELHAHLAGVRARLAKLSKVWQAAADADQRRRHRAERSLSDKLNVTRRMRQEAERRAAAEPEPGPGSHEPGTNGTAGHDWPWER